jgi:hypothetical protein
MRRLFIDEDVRLVCFGDRFVRFRKPNVSALVWLSCIRALPFSSDYWTKPGHAEHSEAHEADAARRYAFTLRFRMPS